MIRTGISRRVKLILSALSGPSGGGGGGSPIFNLPLQTGLGVTYAGGDGTPTFTRASTAYQTDFEGKQNLVPSGAARMQGARVVQNLLPASNAWTKTGSVTLTSGFADPLGGVNAYQAVAAGSGSANRVQLGNYTPTVNGTGVISVYLMGAVGGESVTINDSEGGVANLTLTNGWVRYSNLHAMVASNPYSVYAYATSGTPTFYVFFGMLENVQGQSNQNPSEPVSVGVLSAPYQGLGVDGIQAFSTLNSSVVTNNVVSNTGNGAAINSSNAKFAVLPGVSGSYFSTPSAAANQITGDIDIRVAAALKWSTAGEQTLIAKSNSGGGNRSYRFAWTAGTGLVMYTYVDGSTAISSSVGMGTPTDYTKQYVRATVSVNNGAGGNTVTFYTSVDGVNWVIQGSPVVNVGTTSIFAGAAAVEVGSVNGGTAVLASGNIYRVQIYSGINGTLAVDFNPNLSTSAQTFTAATGEVWTTNGTARIFGNTNATYGIPAQWDANGPLGEIDEPSFANLIGLTAAKVRTMTDVGWVATNMTVATTTGVDGVAASSARLTATAGNATILFTPGLGAAVRTFAPFIKRITGSGTISTTGDVADGYVAQTITAVYAQYPLTTSSAVPVVGYKITTNGDAIDVDFNQLVAGSVAPVTAVPVNVTTAAEVDQYVSAGNLPTTHSGTMSLTPGTALGSATVFHFASYVDANNYTAVLSDGTNLIARKRIGGANHDATVAFTRTVGTAVKIGWRVDTVNGVDIWLSGTKGTNNSTTTASQIGAAFQVGADGNGASQDSCEHRFLYIWSSSLSDYILGALTT